MITIPIISINKCLIKKGTTLPPANLKAKLELEL